jgi:hypothetical protein
MGEYQTAENNEIYERLHIDRKTRDKMKESRKEQQKVRELADCTFSPRINTRSKAIIHQNLSPSKTAFTQTLELPNTSQEPTHSAPPKRTLPQDPNQLIMIQDQALSPSHLSNQFPQKKTTTYKSLTPTLSPSNLTKLSKNQIIIANPQKKLRNKSCEEDNKQINTSSQKIEKKESANSGKIVKKVKSPLRERDSKREAEKERKTQRELEMEIEKLRQRGRERQIASLQTGAAKQLNSPQTHDLNQVLMQQREGFHQNTETSINQQQQHLGFQPSSKQKQLQSARPQKIHKTPTQFQNVNKGVGSPGLEVIYEENTTVKRRSSNVSEPIPTNLEDRFEKLYQDNDKNLKKKQIKAIQIMKVKL